MTLHRRKFVKQVMQLTAIVFFPFRSLANTNKLRPPIKPITSEKNNNVIRKNGKTYWRNIHVTTKQTVEDIIDIDNSNLTAPPGDKYEILNRVTKAANDLILEAKAKKKQIRAIGSAWALTNIQLTGNWLLNTKLLNSCFETDEDCFHHSYPKNKRSLLVIAQCGISIGELNVYLELPKNSNQLPRALKTAGIGAGQTIAGAVSGNTHGAAVNFGALPEFVAAIQLCNGTGKPIWIERSDYPVMNELFLSRVNSSIIRDSDIFNSTLVSFGAFGVITALAIETEPLSQIEFPKIKEISQENLGLLLQNPSYYSKLQHLEFVFNPYEEIAYLIEGTKVPYEDGHPIPKPLWIITNPSGYALGDRTPSFLLKFPFLSGRRKAKILFKNYLDKAVLTNVRGTPGQLYTATITYLEGAIETALCVSTNDALATLKLLKDGTKEMNLPLVFQSRVIKPGNAVLGFTNHFPRAVVFEFGVVNGPIHARFETLLMNKLKNANIRYTLHWSKNSGLDFSKLEEMYGKVKINTWKRSRYTLFNNDRELINIFDNEDIRLAGLDTPAL